jgi:hypothetical protein
MSEEKRQPIAVKITDIDIPFGSLFELVMKLVIVMIPATIVLGIFFFFVGVLLGALGLGTHLR